MENSEFEWDEEKRFSNLVKHGIDFVDAPLLFMRPYLRKSARTTAGEQRWIAIGMIEDEWVAAIYTERGSAIRLISVRRARRGERKAYDEAFGG